MLAEPQAVEHFAWSEQDERRDCPRPLVFYTYLLVAVEGNE
jgi:hypothetical protein